jgi:hypothetical protein
LREVSQVRGVIFLLTGGRVFPATEAHGHEALVVIAVHDDRNADLLKVARTGGLSGIASRATQRGKQDADQDGNDADDNEQLDQCERAAAQVSDSMMPCS